MRRAKLIAMWTVTWVGQFGEWLEHKADSVYYWLEQRL